MKKIILLMAMGQVCISALAQENSSVRVNHAGSLPVPAQGVYPVTQLPHRDLNYEHPRSGMRTTVTSYADWFDYYNQNSGSTGGTIYYFITYPDSNLVDNTGTSPYNVFCHGMGMSFDPTDGAYYSLYGASTTIPISDGPVTNTMNYSIDSFAVPFQYVQNDHSSGTDSLIIELFATSMLTGSGSTAVDDSGVYELMFPASATGYAITADSTPRFATALYTRQASALGPNECWDSITSTGQRYAFALGNGDTAAANVKIFNLYAPLFVPAGRKVVSFVHFKPASSYSLGTTIGSANYIKLYGGTTGSSATDWPQQTAHDASGVPSGYPGSYQTGLIAQNQNRYSDAGFAYMGHNIVIPGVAFNEPNFAVTVQSFHVTWPPLAPIAGTTEICVRGTTTLSDPVSGGSWSSGTTSVATVNSSGVVTGVSVGSSIISYTTSSGSTYTTVTVLPVPSTPTITGTLSVCSGQSTVLTPSEGGGTWTSMSTGVATVNSSGAVYGVSAGTAVISYSISNICGSSAGAATVTVLASPSAGTITGRDTVCPELTVTLADAVTGGTWSSASPSVATISATGVLGGVTLGTDVIRYVVSNSSCSDTATLTIQVYCKLGVNTVYGPGAGHITVYPNPNEGNFNLLLSSPVTEQANVRVTNITGQIVKEFTMATNKTGTVALNGAPGIYFLSVTLQGGTYVEKITILK